MCELRVSKRFGWDGEVSEKCGAVMRMFGLDVERLRCGGVSHECSLSLERGQVCYITGPSGSGKSVVLNGFYESADEGERLRLCDIELADDRSVVDCVEGGVVESLRVLSRAGLSDAFVVLNRPSVLSDGQKYRYRLSRAMASEKGVIFADEFCESLDIVTASVISYQIRKFARESGKIFVLAGCREDVLSDLRPDVIVMKHLNGEAKVIRSSS